jgi:hypothetical protein
MNASGQSSPFVYSLCGREQGSRELLENVEVALSSWFAESPKLGALAKA